MPPPKDSTKSRAHETISTREEMLAAVKLADAPARAARDSQAPLRLEVARLHPKALLPAYQTPGSVALDLAPYDDVMMQPEETLLIRCGLVARVPAGYGLLVLPRSSTFTKWKLRVQIGLVDQDYRGPDDELLIHATNRTYDFLTIPAGTRLAQAFLVPIPHLEVVEIAVAELETQSRGGFGSTGPGGAGPNGSTP